MSQQPLSQSDVERALSGDRAAMRRLVGQLRPAVQATVAWTLTRHAPSGRRDTRQEVGDLVQEVFLALLADGGRLLRMWDPARGKTLVGFVRLIARQQVLAILRSGRRNPWTEDPTEAQSIERSSPATPSAARRVESAAMLQRLLVHLQGSLSARGWLLFEALYVQQKSVEQVCAAFEMSTDAVYAWRSRLRKAAARAREELESTGVSSDAPG